MPIADVTARHDQEKLQVKNDVRILNFLEACRASVCNLDISILGEMPVGGNFFQTGNP